MKIISLLFLFVDTLFFGQQRFDCYNISPEIAKSKYYSLKYLGMDYKFPKGKEVVPNVIDMLGYNGLRQVCIDAAYKNHQIGTERQYNDYIRSIRYISKQDFYENYDYLLIFDEVVRALENSTSYKRTR